MIFKTDQRERGMKLIREGFFDGDPGGGVFLAKPYPFVLQNGLLNLYPAIRDGAIEYFKLNKVHWWPESSPTGHVLSSQIACLNHLFPIRESKGAALSLLKSVSDDFVDVLPIKESMQGFISFEAVGGDVNFLNEKRNTRGRNCTSVDALIIAVKNDGRRFLIPIEWKHVEKYSNKDQAKDEKYGEARKRRYEGLIRDSRYLNGNALSWYGCEPFYQLARQTLWAEQILKNKPEGFGADDYLHLHVIPDGNAQLLNKTYPCSGKNMEATWRSCLADPSKYVVISPEKLWSRQDVNADKGMEQLRNYLKKRYW
jgi:hypothetical protein